MKITSSWLRGRVRKLQNARLEAADTACKIYDTLREWESGELVVSQIDELRDMVGDLDGVSNRLSELASKLERITLELETQEVNSDQAAIDRVEQATRQAQMEPWD